MIDYSAQKQSIQQQLSSYVHPNNENTENDDENLRREHYHMMRQDYQGLFYRKLNLIIMLEQSEQAYHQREILMISHRQRPNDATSRNHHMDVHPVTYLAKEMVKNNELLKKEMKMRKKEAEIKVEINKLDIDRKCLLEEISIFTNKIADIAQEYFEDNACKDGESGLMEHGKRYNLSTTIIAFIKQAKEITVHNIIYECLKVSLKRINSNNIKPVMKLQDLKLNHSHSKSKKELVQHITLYLKEFRSSAIFKELTQILNSLINTYDKINLTSHYLYNKIADEIYSNLQSLSRINKELQGYSNSIKDYKIQIQILVEQGKITNKNIRQLEEKSAQCIAEEAAYLSRQYGVSKNTRQIDTSFSNVTPHEQSLADETDYFSFFHQQLKQKYQQFVKDQLEDAEHIRILKERIEDQTINLDRLKNYFHFQTKSPQSQLQTHRTIDQSVFSEFTYPLKQAQTNSNQPNTINNTINNDDKQKQHSLRRNSKQITLLSCLQQKKQIFLVKKLFNISNNHRNFQSTHRDQDKVYELKLTKKHLILQQKTNNILRLNQKVQINRIKGHKYQQSQQWICFDCGLNSLKLQFVSGNITSFISKLDKLYKMAKENYLPSRRLQH